MASDASIYQYANQPTTRLLDPYEIQARKNAIRNSLAQGTLQDQQIQGGQLALMQQRQAMASKQAARDYLQPPANSLAPAPAPGGPAPAGPLPFSVDGGVNPDATAGGPLRQAQTQPVAVPARPAIPTMADLIRHGVDPGDAAGLIESFQKVDKTSADIDSTRATALKATNEANESIAQQQSDMANAVVKSGMNPAVLNWHLQHYASLGPQQAQQAQAVGQRLTQLAPADQLALMTSLAGAPKTVEANAKIEDAGNITRETDAKLPGLNADSLLKQLTATGKAPIQPEQQARLTMEGNAQAESRRHNRVEEGNAAQNRESVALTPAALDQMSTFFATTGQLPNLGMGAAVAKTRADIINHAAEKYPNVTFASNAANYQANKSSLRNVQGTLDTLSAFENAGLKNLKMFTDAAAKIPDTGVPWLNTPVRLLDEKLVGSTNMSVVNAARQIGLREIARVTNDPKLSGVLSDSARKEVQDFSPINATLPQIIAVTKTLQSDMANVHSSLTDQRDAINNRIGTDPNAKPAAAPAAASAHAVGDTVMYNGAAHKVLEVKPNGKLVLAN